MSNMFSYSKVSCFENCQYQFFIKYILKLEAKFDEKPDNALVLGTAVHESIETKDPIEAIKKYYSNYSKLTIDNEIEAYKVKLVADNAIKDLPRGIYEYKLMSDEFIGFIEDSYPNQNDYFYDVNGDTSVDGRDLITSKKYNLGLTEELGNYDSNNDDSCDGRDIIQLKKKMLGLIID